MKCLSLYQTECDCHLCLESIVGKPALYNLISDAVELFTCKIPVIFRSAFKLIRLEVFEGVASMVLMYRVPALVTLPAINTLPEFVSESPIVTTPVSAVIIWLVRSFHSPNVFELVIAVRLVLILSSGVVHIGTSGDVVV